MARLALHVALHDEAHATAAAGLGAYLAACGLTPVGIGDRADAILVLADPADGATRSGRALPAALLQAAAAGTPVLLAGPTLWAWRELSPLVEQTGVLPGPLTATHEVRLRPGPEGHALAARLAGDLVLTDRWPTLDKVLDDVEVLLTANVALIEHPVMTWRRSGIGVFTIGSTVSSLEHPEYRRLVLRWVRHALGLGDPAPVRVGLLGYGAIGHEHNGALGAVDGLELAGVCDRSPERVRAARDLAPATVAFPDGEALIDSPDVDLVVVSTPPDTHASWALRALAAGKHVVLEKPFALTVGDADEVLEAAARTDRVVAVYQNRRWDADYLVVKRLVGEGALGEVFHYESFVGGYGHPCNFWHSDAAVSGGAVYDWGSHYLDWALDLMPQPVLHVTAAEHKRVWHDVTNADHSRVTLRFADGAEAEFIHSDLAAALKPKWYVLGTRGALVGHWREERIASRGPVGTLIEDRLAPAEAPAALSLHAPDGSVTRLAVPEPLPHAFHRELADRLLTGAPMTVTADGSRRVVAVIEAAARSAA
ncbi:MAG TPA: Gfo/Idh/MocA family oxidoreductase, partial [Mycobacteriales bacterium]|nr:Gfo/Idh/MocA family oxidoreductase [Mycobacteriales bacterium]